jgi:hypothetical protein
MKISLELGAVLLSILFLTSGCATLSYPEDGTAERISWREYLDC